MRPLGFDKGHGVELPWLNPGGFISRGREKQSYMCSLVLTMRCPVPPQDCQQECHCQLQPLKLGPRTMRQNKPLFSIKFACLGYFIVVVQIEQICLIRSRYFWPPLNVWQRAQCLMWIISLNRPWPSWSRSVEHTAQRFRTFSPESESQLLSC
jgi:hypothetical protein